MKIGSIAAMILVTIFAVAVMLASGTKLFTSKKPRDQEPTAPPPKAAEAPVSVELAVRSDIEIQQRYSGMIRPLERMTLAFEIPGRIERLGKNSNAQTFDDGVRVSKDDVLAVLDSRELQALKTEADALLLQAQQEMQRAIDLKQQNRLSISAVEFLNRETNLRITEARAKLAEEKLRNTKLVAPASGVISKRMLSAGESVNAHQPVFKLIQVDEVLLVVGVPEAKIRPLTKRLATIKRLREVGATAAKPFRAHIEIVGRDSFGRPWDGAEGVVRTISETSDETTGLFEVEIAIPNLDGALRPGQIAVAKIVADEIQGYSLPASAAIFQAGQGSIYYAAQASDGTLKAARFWLKEGEYLEQDDRIIIADLPNDIRQVIVSGQHRLAPGRSIRIVPLKRQNEDRSQNASSQAGATSDS